MRLEVGSVCNFSIKMLSKPTDFLSELKSNIDKMAMHVCITTQAIVEHVLKKTARLGFIAFTTKMRLKFQLVMWQLF